VRVINFRIIIIIITAATSITRGQQNFARSLVVSCAGTLYIHFGAFAPLTEFCHMQNSLCVQVLHSAILAAALLHGTPAAGLSQTLQCGMWYKELNYGTFADGTTYI